MSRSWYRFTDEESGPYTFQELAEMFADGDLVENDLIRREEAETWQQVKDVVGLKRAADQLKNPTDKSSPEISDIPTGGLDAGSAKRSSPLRIFVGVLSVVMILFFVGQLIVMWMSRPTRFPEAPANQLAFEVPKRLDQIRPRLPQTPTVPGLEPGVPVPVPGFESVSGVKAPSVSSDLLTIIYVMYTGGETQDDLWTANRSSIELPFANHRLISTTATTGLQEHPALSPSGLELVYSEMGAVNKLWIATREDTTAPFGAPQPVQLEGDGIQNRHCDNPQWIDADTLKVAVADVDYRQRRQLVFRRTEPDGPFKFVNSLLISNGWPRYQFANHLGRAYCPDEAGILITAFHTANKQYLTPEVLLSSDVLGSKLHDLDDTLWVAPKEDVIFYCSPGPGAKENDPRRLWMVHPGKAQ